MSLPQLVVNRGFMAEFLEADPPCFGLGLVEVGDVRCALVALRPDQPIPRHVTDGGFAFGHSLLGGEDWEVVHFAFEFYGHATYNVLVNPSGPVARAVLEVMVGTGDYFFFAINADRRGMSAFRSSIDADSLAGLKANMDRIRRSTTSEAQYRLAAAQFEGHPVPPGTLLTWACQGDTGHLDLVHDRLVLNPA